MDISGGFSMKKSTNEIQNDFYLALLEPSLNKALEIANEFVFSSEDIKIFLEDVITPSLYILGKEWAIGKISVGQEHAATSICQLVISKLYYKIAEETPSKRKLLVTTAPKELHQIGSRMIADILEINSYDIYYVGDGDIEKILAIMKEESIFEVVISSTIKESIVTTKNIIHQIRDFFKNQKIYIYVGGQAYEQNNSDCDVGADYCIFSIDSLLEILKRNGTNVRLQ